MYQQLKAFWASLPHGVQALVITFVAAAGASLGHALSEPDACFKLACLKHYVGTAVVAGVIALRAFYMLPNGTAQLVAQAKAQNQSPQNPPQQ